MHPSLNLFVKFVLLHASLTLVRDVRLLQEASRQALASVGNIARSVRMALSDSECFEAGMEAVRFEALVYPLSASYYLLLLTVSELFSGFWICGSG